MPVRSLPSSVLRWPEEAAVVAAVRAWAERLAAGEPTIERIGIVGSYARGDWGVGSDVDIVVIVDTDEPFERRGLRFETSELPVPADLLVYTRDEWARMVADGRLARLAREARWLVDRAAERGGGAAEDGRPH